MYGTSFATACNFPSPEPVSDDPERPELTVKDWGTSRSSDLRVQTDSSQLFVCPVCCDCQGRYATHSSRTFQAITKRDTSLLVRKARQDAHAVPRLMEKGDRAQVGDSLAMSKDVVHVWIRRPAIALPNFHRQTTLSGDPSSHQKAAHIVEMHRSSPGELAGLTIHCVFALEISGRAGRQSCHLRSRQHSGSGAGEPALKRVDQGPGHRRRSRGVRHRRSASEPEGEDLCARLEAGARSR